ncbi:hypothetical protein MUNTM_05210 [Mycobacterium sp. MUNTM1]
MAAERPSGVFSSALSEPPAGAGVVVSPDDVGAPLFTGGVVPGWVLACCGELQAVIATTGSPIKKEATKGEPLNFFMSGSLTRGGPADCRTGPLDARRDYGAA